MTATDGAGPLRGVNVIELGSIGPVPFAAMLLADMGAEVVRVDAPGRLPEVEPTKSSTLRGRRNVVLDLRHPAGRDALLTMVERADALVEGFRPGVCERLGIGPEDCLARNPALVFGRMTGWGQSGPISLAPGHDLNYIALAGALAHFPRRSGAPAPPLNLVGDYAGGALYLVAGVLAALLPARESGIGQVVDAAMIDGVASLMSLWWEKLEDGSFDETKPGSHYFDTGAHYFEVYECADGKWISVGAIEEKFYRELLRMLELESDPLVVDRTDPARWPAQKERFAEVFKSQTRDQWERRAAGRDVCVAPVLTMSEAARHPQLAERGTIVSVDGRRQPAPAPRFGVSGSAPITRPAAYGEHTVEALVDWGVPKDVVTSLVEQGIAAQSSEDELAGTPG